jgi:3-oxoacyl-[acyl-carrier protein] reductase
MMAERPLSAQVAVVTGASRGIGAAIARKLALLGARTILTARDRGRLESQAEKIRGAGGEAEFLECDLENPERIEAFAREVLNRNGRVDILVNNAGIGWFDGPLHNMPLEQWDKTIATNLRAPYLLLRAFAPAMVEAGHGHIVNISSLAGKNPVPNAAAYAASKWGLNGMMISAAEELRAAKVRVSLVEPGTVRSEFGSEASSKKSALGAIHPEDIAEIVALLVTQPDQTFISEVLVRPTLKK